MAANTNRNLQGIEVNRPLLTSIQSNKSIIIASDGSQSPTKSGGVWLIVDESDNENVKGYNHDFGKIDEIKSHRSEIYFFIEYCIYYSTLIVLEVDSNLNNIKTNRKPYSSNNKKKILAPFFRSNITSYKNL